MNKELIETSSAIRGDLLALSEVTDLKELAALLKQKMPAMKRNYAELALCMTAEQRDQFQEIFAMEAAVNFLSERGSKTVPKITKVIPRVIALLDDIRATFSG